MQPVFTELHAFISDYQAVFTAHLCHPAGRVECMCTSILFSCVVNMFWDRLNHRSKPILVGVFICVQCTQRSNILVIFAKIYHHPIQDSEYHGTFLVFEHLPCYSIHLHLKCWRKKVVLIHHQNVWIHLDPTDVFQVGGESLVSTFLRSTSDVN